MTTKPWGSGSSPDHREVWEILPWYVNGSLEDHELQRIEQHLHDCEECRREVAYLNRLSLVLVSTVSPAKAPDHAFSEVLARIETVDSPTPTSSFLRRLRDTFSPKPLWRPVVVIQTLLILGLAALLWQRGAETPSVFRTLSRPVTQAPSSGLLVRMVFASEVGEEDLRRLLLEVHAQIVAGPSPHGVYTVEITSPVDADAIAHVLEEIRAREEVEFLEPLVQER